MKASVYEYLSIYNRQSRTGPSHKEYNRMLDLYEGMNDEEKKLLNRLLREGVV